MLSLVVARARNGAIGKDGAIPWRAPEDLAFFQRETIGGAVIMGRRTWDSLPKKPLPRRMNIVVTSGPGGGDAEFCSLNDAVPAALASGYTRIYGIGGQAIYEALFPLADRLLVTEVECDVDGADTFFPVFDLCDWYLANRLELRAFAPRCVLCEYLRKHV